MKGKLWNNPCAYFQFMTLGFAWSSGFILTFCSGGAKFRCGIVLAIDFDDFYYQLFSWFHAFKAIFLINSLTLMSSTSFQDYLNAGTKCMKTGQNWENSQASSLGQACRPTHYGFTCSSFASVFMSSRPSHSKLNSWQIHILRPKGLDHRWMGPHGVPKLNFWLATNFKEDMQPLMGMSV